MRTGNKRNKKGHRAQQKTKQTIKDTQTTATQTNSNSKTEE